MRSDVLVPVPLSASVTGRCWTFGFGGRDLGIVLSTEKSREERISKAFEC